MTNGLVRPLPPAPNQGQSSSQSGTPSTARKNCPSPTPQFDARKLRNAKWSSNEEVSKFGQAKTGSSGNGSGKQVWTPANGAESPSLERRKAKDYKPVGFDGNSLQRSEQKSNKETKDIDPNESFAWKDSTLDRKLKELEERAKQQSALRGGEENGFDKNIDKSIGNWSSLPKVTNPDVILLQKAREEKKVKKYLEDNYQHRTDLISPLPELKSNGEVLPEPPKKYQGVGPKTKEGNNSGYASEPETGRQSSYAKFANAESRGHRSGSSISEPPQFNKRESRFEREQKIKVGSVNAYVPGAPTAVREEFSPPPGVSGAQQQYDKERFRVQPGRIEDYSLGRGSLAQKEAQQAHRAGCSITRYSSSHSFNPLASSKSEHNLSSQTYSVPQKFHLQSAIKDGYESDSTLVFKRRENHIPRSQTPAEAKSAYTQIQKGGDIPLDGLRMSLPDKQRESRAKYNEGEVNIHYKTPIRREEKEFIPEDELRKRQEDQMRKFYEDIEHKKEQELLQDMQNRKHHDTLLPIQKSPIPLNRYEELANGDQQSTTPQSTLNRNYKMVSRALYNFQAQNYRELSFKKGDLVYIRRQVDDNWYEGERNAMIGIFPVTYVEMIPNENVGSLSRKSSGGGTLPRGGSGNDQLTEGKGKAKFNFQAQTPMELSLIKGEIVILTRRVDANWYEGRIGSRKGIFPATYIEVLLEPGETRGLSPTPIIKPVAAPAAHSILKNGSLPVPSYNPNYSVTSPYSTINSRPGSSMSQTTVTQQQMTTSNSFHMECKNEPVPFRALYNYKPQNDDEVELTEGDVVYVMEKCDDGWFVGTSQRTGIFGTFPGNYVAKA